MITNRKLVALVDPATNEYQIDWERSGLVSGMMPATFTIAEDNKTYDLTGQTGPLMEILQILKANGIGMNNMIDLRIEPRSPPAGAGGGASRRRGTAGTGGRTGAAPTRRRRVHGAADARTPRTVYRAAPAGTGDPARHRVDLRRRVHRQAPADHRGLVASSDSSGLGAHGCGAGRVVPRLKSICLE